MSGMKYANLKVGDYVEWGTGNDLKKGLLISLGKVNHTIRENGKKDTVGVAVEDLKLSRTAALGNKFGINLREVFENTVVNGVALRLIYQKDFFGQQSIAFLCSDALYELLLKDSLAPMADFLAVPVSTGPRTFFDTNDFIDLARKLPFTILGQALFQKVMQKKAAFSHLWENVLCQSIAIYGTNLIDRYVVDDDGVYYYP